MHNSLLGKKKRVPISFTSDCWLWIWSQSSVVFLALELFAYLYFYTSLISKDPPSLSRYQRSMITVEPAPSWCVGVSIIVQLVINWHPIYSKRGFSSSCIPVLSNPVHCTCSALAGSSLPFCQHRTEVSTNPNLFRFRREFLGCVPVPVIKHTLLHLPSPLTVMLLCTLMD